MIERALESKLKSAAKQYPVILLTGPRQSGKTTLCQAVFPEKPYISFENPQNQEFAHNDPQGLLNKYPDGAIFDEIQRCPQLLSYLQGIVDARKENGMYVLTGSQNLLLLKSTQQSLAGRVAILKLLPFSIHEISDLLEGYSLDRLLYTGFYPRIYDQKLNPTEALSNYIASYVERDVREIVNIKNLSSFRKFLKLCAGRVGQVLNLSNLGNDVGISHTTASEWLSVLETSYIIYQLPAYYQNFSRRLIKSPKLYFTDTGLACCLLGIEKPEHVSRDPLLGGIFENLIVNEFLKSFAAEGRNAPLYFLRDNMGNEIDLLIEKARKVIAVEIKAGETINADWFKGFHYLDKVMKENVLSSNIVYGGQSSSIRKETHIFSYRNIHDLYVSLNSVS